MPLGAELGPGGIGGGCGGMLIGPGPAEADPLSSSLSALASTTQSKQMLAIVGVEQPKNKMCAVEEIVSGNTGLVTQATQYLALKYMYC